MKATQCQMLLGSFPACRSMLIDMIHSIAVTSISNVIVPENSVSKEVSIRLQTEHEIDPGPKG